MPNAPLQLADFSEKTKALFWKKVDFDGPTMPHMSTPCWVWTAGINRGGYGKLRGKGKRLLAHRVSWVLSGGIIASDKPCVLHACDNRNCVNPAHLWNGTRTENAADRDAKGRGNPARGDRSGARTHPERLARGSRSGVHTHPESVRRGDSKVNAKLTEAIVLSMRIRRAAGETIRALGREFGVCYPVARCAIIGKTWAHVGGLSHAQLPA